MFLLNQLTRNTKFSIYLFINISLFNLIPCLIKHTKYFIKIDVESAEYQVLKGSENTIDKYHPIITLEVGDKDLPGIITSRELIDYLEGKGYQSFEYKKGKINKHQLKKRYSYDNILFFPEQYSQNND